MLKMCFRSFRIEIWDTIIVGGKSYKATQLIREGEGGSDDVW